jgi:hypothetical protein
MEEIQNLADLFTSEAGSGKLIDTFGDLDLFFGNAVAQAVPLAKIKIAAWTLLTEVAQRKALLTRAGVPIDPPTLIDTVLAEINMAWPVIFPPVVQVKAEAKVTIRQGAIPTRDALMSRMRNSAAAATAFGFGAQDAERLGLFAYLYQTYGYEAAHLDMLVYGALKGGAGAYVQNAWLFQVLDRYSTKKPKAADMLVPANEALDLPEFHLEILDQDQRLTFWTGVNETLLQSGFYTLIEQLAFWARATGKASALAKFSNVTTSLSDSRYDPDQMQKLHQRVIKALSSYMEDRTRAAMADRIALEHMVVVQNALEDEDVLHFLCKPPRNVQDVVHYFWNTDKIDLNMERTALQMSAAIRAAIEALALYDPSRPYVDQMDTFTVPANDAYTLIAEMGVLAPQRYGLEAPKDQTIDSFVAAIMAAVSVEVVIGPDGTIVVKAAAMAGASVGSTKKQRGANGLYPLSDEDIEFIKQKRRELHIHQLRSWDTTSQMMIPQLCHEIANRVVQVRVGVAQNYGQISSVGWAGSQYQRQDEEKLRKAYANRNNGGDALQEFATAWYVIIARNQAWDAQIEMFD